MVEQLLRLKAECTAADATGCTPLHAAATGGHSAIVARLLAVGAAPAASDPAGRTPLHWAAKNGHAVTVGVLADALQSANADWHLQVWLTKMEIIIRGVLPMLHLSARCTLVLISPSPQHCQAFCYLKLQQMLSTSKHPSE